MYWTAFTAWIALAVPTSLWPGNSLSILAAYLRTDLIMLFVIAGLAVTWRHCRLLMYAIAWGCAINLLTARFFQNDLGGRLSLNVGAVADPNDFAAHLLLVLPFLLWIALAKRGILVRAGAFAGIGAGLFLILRTASRGAAVGLLVEVLFFLLRANMRQRLAMFALVPAAAITLAIAVPQSALVRIRSFSAADPNQEAFQSAESREYLFRKSIAYTIQHPLFGVGPGEFPEYEGEHNRLAGKTHGYWQETHNTLTQVSSECGIPAAIFFIAAIVSTFSLLKYTYRQARRRADCADIATAAFCIMLGFTGFCAAVMFLNFAYFFYFPAMGGLGIAVASAARAEFQQRGDAPEQPKPSGPAAPTHRPVSRTIHIGRPLRGGNPLHSRLFQMTNASAPGNPA
jgi:O-antigen ligase